MLVAMAAPPHPSVLEGVRYPLWRPDTLVRKAYAQPGMGR
jgi:hypothetical protein